jgi:hypothetical protein
LKGKCGGGVEVQQEQDSRSFRLAAQNLDFLQNKNPPGTIGHAEEILNRYEDRGSGCAFLVIGKHGHL